MTVYNLANSLKKENALNVNCNVVCVCVCVCVCVKRQVVETFGDCL